ncbi:MAG: hypothetical protein ACREUU_08370 [Gammaproteobacteria bacterium]
MTVTVELKPEVEASLVAQARAKGLPLDRYIQDLIEQLASLDVQAMTPKEREQAFDEWADSIEVPAGVKEEAFHRENWYR